MKEPSKAKDQASSGGFRGFGSQTLPFLEALKANNDRQWFAENKPTFIEECDTPLRELVADVAGRLAKAGSSLAPIARNPVFRIYRDVRFSKDKSPYKTNLGTAFYREGDKSRPGLLYIHIEPGKSFIAAGIYQPEPSVLQTIRASIAEESPAFEKMLAKLKAKGLVLSKDDSLARIPKGFEDHAKAPVADYLRLRSFITVKPLADDDLERRELPETIVKFAGDTLPLLEHLWSRI